MHILCLLLSTWLLCHTGGIGCALVFLSPDMSELCKERFGFPKEMQAIQVFLRLRWSRHFDCKCVPLAGEIAALTRAVQEAVEVIRVV